MLTLNDGRTELWQWDTGRTLAVDADCSQVHFSNKVFGRSIDVDVADGVATIPDVLLQTDKDLNVWAFVGTAENGYTKISKTFKVNRRNKPADYVFTPTDQTYLEEIKEKLDYLESIQDPDAIKNAVADYISKNPITVEETDPTVPAWAKEAQKPSYTASEVGADPSGTAAAQVTAHNTAEAAHNDIRLLISGLTDRLNALTDSDDTTLDQLSEVVSYIKSNRSLIEAITTSKVSVSDIIDNLTTNIANKPLSAAQGVALKALIDGIVIPDKLPNPNALTFTGAVTGSYDGSEAVTVNIPSGGSGGGVSAVNGVGPDANGNVYAESNYKEMVTLVSDTLTEETAGLKQYEYDIDGLDMNDLLLLFVLFPNSYSATIKIKDQSGHTLTDEFPVKTKGMLVGLKMMNGRYLHAASYQSNLAARVDLPLSLFYGQLNGASGFERPKARNIITRLSITFSTALESGTSIKIMRM